MFKIWKSSDFKKLENNLQFSKSLGLKKFKKTKSSKPPKNQENGKNQNKLKKTGKGWIVLSNGLAPI
jgi:hypothetical protein